MEPKTDVLNFLASALGRRDEVPNQELAIRLSQENDTVAIADLVEQVNHKKKDVANDCIKVLYEIGNIDPKLVSAYAPEFILLLEHKNNRLQWGAMTALETITLEAPDLLFSALPKLMLAADKGSVITKDYMVNILIKLCSIEKYRSDAFELLLELMRKSPTNQLPMYAERALSIVEPASKDRFVSLLADRLPEIEKESKQKRILSVMKKLK